MANISLKREPEQKCFDNYTPVDPMAKTNVTFGAVVNTLKFIIADMDR